MIFSCDEGREEDRCMPAPTAEAADTPEIGPVPLEAVYLHKDVEIKISLYRKKRFTLSFNLWSHVIMYNI